MFKGTISLGTIIFWGFIGWMWFGDSITGFFKTNINIKVNEETISIDVNEIVNDVKKELVQVKNELLSKDDEEKEPESEKEPEPEKKERVVIVQQDTDNFSNDDIYGDYSNKDKY